MKYTDYCTTFYVPGEKKVYFWDEIKDKVIEKQKVKNKEEAERVMKEYKDNAPDGVICHILN